MLLLQKKTFYISVRTIFLFQLFSGKMIITTNYLKIIFIGRYLMVILLQPLLFWWNKKLTFQKLTNSQCNTFDLSSFYECYRNAHQVMLYLKLSATTTVHYSFCVCLRRRKFAIRYVFRGKENTTNIQSWMYVFLNFLQSY